MPSRSVPQWLSLFCLTLVANGAAVARADASPAPTASLSASPSPSISPSPSPTPSIPPSPGPSPLASPSPTAPTATSAPSPDHEPALTAFPIGERHEFSVSWLGISGLKVALEVLPFEQIDDKKAYHVRADIRNSTLLGIFYRINDTAESWFEAERRYSCKLRVNQDESKLQRDVLEIHSAEKGETLLHDRKQRKGEALEEIKATFKVTPFSQDSLSAVYYMRALPLKVGYKAKVPVISEGRMLSVLIQVTRRETDWEVPREDEDDEEDIPVLAVNLKKLDEQGNPIAGAENTVWVTDDERRIILQIDVTARIGRVTAKLKRYERGPIETTQR